MVETPTNSPLRKKSAKATVMEWRKLHPKGKKSDCIKETKLAHATVDRWWTEKSEQFKYRSGSAEDIVMEWRTMNPFGERRIVSEIPEYHKQLLVNGGKNAASM